MHRVVVAREPFGSAWPESQALTLKHFLEVEVGVSPHRRLEPDTENLGLLSRKNFLICITARVAGRLIGYFTWTVTRDLESKGLLIANQGAWYLQPGFPRVASRMFDRSIAELKLMGVRCIFPHHRLHGRGKSLGRFFKRRGAVETKAEYMMWIGDDA